MARPEQRQAEANRLLQALNPSAFTSRLDEYERGSLPSSSVPESVAGTKDYTPRPDRFDKTVRSTRDSYSILWYDLTKTLRELAKLEVAWIPPHPVLEPGRYRKWMDDMDRLAREVRQARAVECANPHCVTMVERTAVDRLIAGRCEPCYRYRQRNGGTERPKSLCQKEEGEAA